MLLIVQKSEITSKNKIKSCKKKEISETEEKNTPNIAASAHTNAPKRLNFTHNPYGLFFFFTCRNPRNPALIEYISHPKTITI